MKYYSYEEFKEDVSSLVKQTKAFEADTIIAIARGGMSAAQALAHALDIRNVQSVHTRFYDDTIQRDNLEIAINCDLFQSKKVLVVDDIADSGKTLQAVLELLKERFREVEFKSATLFYKKTAVVQPDYTVKEAKDWIEFFWERDFRRENM